MISKITVNQYHLYLLLFQTMDLLVKREEIISSKIGITREKYIVLMTIKYYQDVLDEQITITGIASILKRSITSISTIINRSEKEGLVIKNKDLSDGRAIHLILTPKAEKLLKKASKPFIELVRKIFSIFSDEELSMLIMNIGRIRHRIIKYFGQTDNKGYYGMENYQKMFDFLIKLNSDR